METIDNSNTGHEQIFPKDQPYKCLYAAFALSQYLESSRREVEGPVGSASTVTVSGTQFSKALSRTRFLTVAALSDDELVDSGLADLLTVKLCSALMTVYLGAIRGEWFHGAPRTLKT